MHLSEPHHIDEQILDDQQEAIFSSILPILGVPWKTSQERWTIETGGERFKEIRASSVTWWSYLPTPPLGQDMTQGQFLSGV